MVGGLDGGGCFLPLAISRRCPVWRPLLAVRGDSVSESNLQFSTPRLLVVATLPAHLRIELDSPERLGPLLGVRVPASWPPGEYDRDAMAFFCGRYDDEGAAAIGWYGWYAIRPAAGGEAAELVGSVGYFGPPSADGTVEIGYSMVPEARCRGYATELARGLAERALALPGVQRVVAHAAHENVASHKVLERAGFRAMDDSAEPGKRRFERAR